MHARYACNISSCITNLLESPQMATYNFRNLLKKHAKFSSNLLKKHAKFNKKKVWQPCWEGINLFNYFITKISPQLDEETTRSKSTSNPTTKSLPLSPLLILMIFMILLKLCMILNVQNVASYLQNC